VSLRIDPRAQARTGFIKDILVFSYAFSYGFLLFQWQMDHFLARCTATTLIFLSAFFTLNKQEMATLIGTVGMIIGRFPTLVTTSNNLFSYSLSQAVVEHEILTLEFIRKA
jgi:hypothetical protein